ncbi:substrate-binding periplasmic protein [Suttonella ornithocola]|uniref:Lysine-arginine-ornithine-binding periplasmic protein n=1 Tax=Suttonella ornithocola TaxID=279832 RepID=A0A380MSA2_9GAMM|nr:ABC transporter substrate-binding protein [Suttonella ornithocola]SUO95509.1 lysine-arginine-ornithine-binding periplasmic protein [Suttonella ornithocola]
MQLGHAYYSKERNENYSMSDPIYIEKLEFIALKDNAEKVKDFNTDKPIYVATSRGSPVEKILDEVIKTYPNLHKTETALPFLGFKSLFTKEADLLFNTQATLDTYQRNYPQYDYIQIPIGKEYQQTMSLHIMARNDDKGKMLTKHINNGLKKQKDNGTYQRLLDKYHLR